VLQSPFGNRSTWKPEWWACEAVELRGPLERMLKVDQVHVIRHKVCSTAARSGSSPRSLGSRESRSASTLRARSRRGRRGHGRPVSEKIGPRLDALLQASKRWTGGRQQLTATLLHELVRGERHQVGVSLVKAAVAEWKRQRREVFVPLVRSSLRAAPPRGQSAPFPQNSAASGCDYYTLTRLRIRLARVLLRRRSAIPETRSGTQ
jgi:hypothetical protein